MRGPPCAVFLPNRKDEAQLSRALLEENNPVRPCLVLWRLFNAEVDRVVVAVDLPQQLHKAAKDALLVGFGRARMPDAESESFRISGRVIAEFDFLASQINELAGQLAGSANVLCDDEEIIFLLNIRANICNLSC